MEPARKNPAIRDFQSTIKGVDVPASIAADRCVSCKQPAAEFKTELARKEFTLSGLCQACQDKLFDDDE